MTLHELTCRRCGRELEEGWQLVDPTGRWAVSAARCDCGHCWTDIHAAVAHVARVRAWVARGCSPVNGPLLSPGGDAAPWRRVRLEGVWPEAAAS